MKDLPRENFLSLLANRIHGVKADNTVPSSFIGPDVLYS
jgi:hypothetical protein